MYYEHYSHELCKEVALHCFLAKNTWFSRTFIILDMQRQTFSAIEGHSYQQQDKVSSLEGTKTCKACQTSGASFAQLVTEHYYAWSTLSLWHVLLCAFACYVANPDFDGFHMEARKVVIYYILVFIMYILRF